MPSKHFTVKVPDHGDPEINVMAVIFAALAMIGEEGRERVLAYIQDRAAPIPLPSMPSMPPLSPMSPDA